MILIHIAASVLLLISDAAYTEQEAIPPETQQLIVLEAIYDYSTDGLPSRMSRVQLIDLEEPEDQLEPAADDEDKVPANADEQAITETLSSQTTADSEETDSRSQADTEEEKDTIIARVTAYAPFDNQSGMCNDGNPNSTSTGQRPGPNIVAVDPKKIPYGTRLKIEGFNRVFVAGDTGSALRNYSGIALDVYFDTYEEIRRFGVQYLEIEILDD